MTDWLTPSLPENFAVAAAFFVGGLICIGFAALGGLDKRDLPHGAKLFFYIVGSILLIVGAALLVSVLFPVSTSTSSPTAEPTEPTLTPVPDYPIVFRDSFDDNRNLWDLMKFEQDYAESTFGIENGVLNMSAVFTSDAVMWRDIPGIQLSSFVVEFDATIREIGLVPNQIPVDIVFGFHHEPQTNYNMAMFLSRGYVALVEVECQPNETVCSIPSEQTKYYFNFSLAKDETHTFRIEVIENSYSLYLDGTLLKTFLDTVSRDAGDLRIGFYGQGHLGLLSVDFDNVVVYQIP